MRRTTLRRTRRTPSLRKRLWPEFSKLIRKRDGKCLMQGDEFGKCGGRLQASHIHPKGSWPLLELFPLNVKTLCYRHHFYVWPNRPREMEAWLWRTLGAGWLAALELERRRVMQRKGMTEQELRNEWQAHGLT